MSKLYDRLTLAALCLLGVVLATVFFARGWHRLNALPVVQAQSNFTPGIKTVIVNKTRRLDPIEVVTVMEAGEEIEPSAPSQYNLQWLVRNDRPVRTTKEFRTAYDFPANDDVWLKNLSVALRNRTSKNIVFVSIGVAFPETKATGPLVWPYVRFGQLPANVAFFGSGDAIPARGEKLLSLAPGEEMTFSFQDHAAHLKTVLENRQSLSSISMCYLHFLVTFDDGTHWSEGGYAAPDPVHPGKSIPLEVSYFPGPLIGSSAD